MDTSETYIKMRIAAIPDLGKGTLKALGKYHWFEGTRVFVDEVGNFYTGEGSWYCQLDRQDQLQEMVGDFNLLKFWQRFFSYTDYVIQMGVGYELPEWAIHCDSWEQLWFAFMMKENHNKVWNGETWH